MYSLRWKEGKQIHVACTSKLEAALELFHLIGREKDLKFIRLVDLENEIVVREVNWEKQA